MNFIYFNPDEMRADVLACYGHPVAKTPNIDRFARMGVRFDQCHVQHTVCTPSRCSFMTGWYPHVAGHRTLWHCLRPHEPNTLRYLKDEGYQVHVIGKNDLLAPGSVEPSVTRIHQSSPGAFAEPAYPPGDPRRKNFLYQPMDGAPGDLHRIEAAIDYLRSRKASDPPFMLYLPTILPHCPYTVPEPWYSMYDPADLPPLRELHGEKPAFHRAIRSYRQLDENNDGDLRKVMAVYLGMVSYVDHLFGRLMESLEETGLAGDTTVFFFSDHGDWAGDYGLVEKWPSGLDDTLRRVPMIVQGPGFAQGHVVKEVIECFDIMASTLELAGIRPDHSHFSQSMVPALKGAPGDPKRAVFAEGGYDIHEGHCFEGKPSDGVAGNPDSIYYPKGIQQQEAPETVSRAVMIRTLGHKLIRRPGGVHELYDYSSDPLEQFNVYGHAGYAEVQQELEERLLDWYIHSSDVVPLEPDPRGWPN